MSDPEHLIEGVLPVDKPAGPTSHDMVARARRALGTRRIGHTGTLDPFASGLLLLCIGRATRIAEYLTDMDKRYTAVVRLGISTDTDDVTGSIVFERDPGRITEGAIERVLADLRGDIMQRPSTYSAKKVDGQRAYALARRGEAVDLAPVPVTIRSLTTTRFASPELEMDVTCSGGTYIRAIARDVGEALGVGAHLTSLRRTAIGPHEVAHAVSADVLESDPEATRAALMPALAALGSMPQIDLSDDDVVEILHGRAVARDPAAHAVVNAVARDASNVDVSGVVALSAHGELVAIAEAVDGKLRPRKVFL